MSFVRSSSVAQLASGVFLGAALGLEALEPGFGAFLFFLIVFFTEAGLLGGLSLETTGAGEASAALLTPEGRRLALCSLSPLAFSAPLGLGGGVFTVPEVDFGLLFFSEDLVGVDLAPVSGNNLISSLEASQGPIS